MHNSNHNKPVIVWILFLVVLYAVVIFLRPYFQYNFQAGNYIIVLIIVSVIYYIIRIIKISRTKAISRLGDEFGLKFQNSDYDGKGVFGAPTKLLLKKNILTGTINKHSIEVYDRHENSVNEGRGNLNTRYTVMTIDGIEKNIKGAGLDYPSTSEIKKELLKLKS